MSKYIVTDGTWTNLGVYLPSPHAIS